MYPALGLGDDDALTATIQFGGISAIKRYRIQNSDVCFCSDDVNSFVSVAAWSHARAWAVGGRIVVVDHASDQFESNKKYPEMPSSNQKSSDQQQTDDNA
jgi:hypothetical protein